MSEDEDIFKPILTKREKVDQRGILNEAKEILLKLQLRLIKLENIYVERDSYNRNRQYQKRMRLEREIRNLIKEYLLTLLNLEVEEFDGSKT